MTTTKGRNIFLFLFRLPFTELALSDLYLLK